MFFARLILSSTNGSAARRELRLEDAPRALRLGCVILPGPKTETWAYNAVAGHGRGTRQSLVEMRIDSNVKLLVERTRTEPAARTRAYLTFFTQDNQLMGTRK